MTPAAKIQLFQTIRNIKWRYQLDQFEDDALKEIVKSVDQARNEIMSELDNIYGEISWTDERNEQLLDELNQLTTGIKAQLNEDVTELSAIAYEKSLLAHNSIMSIGGRAINVAMVQLSGEQIASFMAEPVGGMLLNDWVERTYDHPLQEKLKKEMQAGLFRGESYQKLSARVGDLLGEAGNNTDTMVRTWVQSANTAAQDRVYKKNEDLIKGWKLDSVMENANFSNGHGTCLRCLSLDSRDETYPIDDGPTLPIHPNCRCIKRVKTKSYRELGIPMDDLDDAVRPYTVRGKVDTITGEIKRGKTGVGGQPLLDAGQLDGGYDVFFEELPEQLQIQTLGKGRYQLWKSGKVKLADLADRDGNQLTIAELTGVTAPKSFQPKVKTLRSDLATKKDSFEASIQQYIKGDAEKSSVYQWYKQGAFSRFAFLNQLAVDGRGDIVEKFNAMKKIEYQLADIIPEEEFRQWKREKIQGITNLVVQTDEEVREILFENLDKGFEWVPYNILDEMADDHFQVNVVEKADLHQGLREFYKKRKINISPDSQFEKIAHEWGHAVDDYMSYEIKDFGSINASKNLHNPGLNWRNNDYTTAKEGNALQTYYYSFATGEKREYTNGDGFFWEDNWLDDYEGRIYGEYGVGEEWWAMNIERYGDYRVKSSDSTYYDIEVTRAEATLKRKKEWPTELNIEKAKQDVEMAEEVLEKLKAQGQDSWAWESSSWGAATRRYPELTSLIEKKFGYRNLGG